MSRPIGKGSRFLVLTGDWRGQQCTVEEDEPDTAGYLALEFDDGTPGLASITDLEGLGFKRLSDAPAPRG